MKVGNVDWSGVEERGVVAPPSGFIPSEMQQAVFDWVKSSPASGAKRSANVIAVAGSGKTTTLVHACALMTGSVAVAQFNKKTAEDFNFKLKRAGITHVTAKTFHAYGYGAWKKIQPKFEVDGNKLRDILEDQLRVPEKLLGVTSKLVSLAKQIGLGIHDEHDQMPAIEDGAAWEEIMDFHDLMGEIPEDGQSEDDARLAVIELAKTTLRISNSMEDLIDFDDMIYLPLLKGAPFWKNDWVMIDEEQDTNSIRRMLARRMLKPSGRLLGVGDPRQAIYGFTGASANAMELVAQEFGCIELPLTVSFRCPRAVVRHAQEIVSHIQAAPDAKEGMVKSVSFVEFEKDHMNRQHLGPDSAILCRYTKPLVSQAFMLIRKNIPCHVEGKEIGRGLIALCRKWKNVNALSELREKLNRYLNKETARFIEKRQEQKAEALSDRVETIFVIIDAVEEAASRQNQRATLSDLTRQIESLFGDTPEGGQSRDCTLSTVHKAKGREWPIVFILGRDEYMPSKYAKQRWQLEQEDNLIYVAITRSMDTLIEIRVGT